MHVSTPPTPLFSLSQTIPLDAGWWLLPALFVVTFLLGSIPWGVIVSHLAFHKDIRDEGSGNIGATNALRTMGKTGGLAVLLLDIAKGVASGLLALAVASYVVIDDVLFMYAPLAIGFAGCVFGHIFSPWLHFKGGKGISVAFGCLFILFGVWGALLDLLVFIIFVAATRYVSLGSIMAAVACPLIGLYCYWSHWFCVALIAIAAFTVIWAHRANIGRLIKGNESKLSFKKEKGA